MVSTESGGTMTCREQQQRMTEPGVYWLNVSRREQEEFCRRVNQMLRNEGPCQCDRCRSDNR